MVSALSKLSNWKLIAPTFLLFAVFSFYLFPHYQSRMVKAAGEPVAPLDTRFSYNVEEVHRDFDKLGPDGRDVYRTVVGIVDMIYPPVYGLLLVLILAWLLKKLFGYTSSWIHLSLLPVVGIIFDYLENVNTLRLLDQYPRISSEAVRWGEIMTIIKHVAGLSCVSLIAVFAIALLIKRAKARTAPALR